MTAGYSATDSTSSKNAGRFFGGDAASTQVVEDFWQQLMLVGVRYQAMVLYGQRNSMSNPTQNLPSHAKYGTAKAAGAIEDANCGLAVFGVVDISHQSSGLPELIPYTASTVEGENMFNVCNLASAQLSLAVSNGFKLTCAAPQPRQMALELVRNVVLPLARAREYHQRARQLADLIDQCLDDEARAVVSPQFQSVWADVAVEAARTVLLLEGEGPLQMVHAPPPSTAEELPVLWRALEMLAAVPEAPAGPSSAQQEGGEAPSTRQDATAHCVDVATAAAIAVVQLAIATSQRPLAVKQAVLSAQVDFWVHADRVLKAKCILGGGAPAHAGAFAAAAAAGSLAADPTGNAAAAAAGPEAVG
jgi:hypothetical protein